MRQYLFIVFVLSSAISKRINANPVIDSLEVLMAKAEPGWDQIDYAVGLARLHIGGEGDFVNGDRCIDIIYKNAESENIPEARAYGAIMEGITFYHKNDPDSRIQKCEEALAIAKKYNCNDAYVFGGYQLSEAYWVSKGDFEKALEVAESIIPLVDETVDIKHIANFYKTIGNLYTRTGQPELGFEYFDKALVLFDQMKTNPFIDPRTGRVSAQYGDIDNLKQFALTNMGLSKLRLGYPEESRELLMQALDLAKKSKRKRLIAWQYNIVGEHYEWRGYYQKALQNYQEARVLLEVSAVPTYLARSDALLARVMLNLADFENAKIYADKAQEFYKSKSDTLHWSEQLFIQTLVNVRQGNLTQTLSYVEELNQLIIGVRNPETLGKYYQVLGEVALSNQDPTGAVKDFKKSLNHYEENQNQYGKIETLNLWSEALLSLNQNDSAFYYAKMALSSAQLQNNIAFTRKAYLQLSAIYEQLSKPDLALDNYKTFISYNDSVFTADTQVKLKEEQVRRNVETYKADKALAEANAQLMADRNQMYLIIGVVMLLVLVLVGYLAYSFQRVKAKVQLQNEQLSDLNKTKDKFFGIIAHDMRSPLLGLQSVGEQISFFIKKNQPEMLGELSLEIENTTERLTNLLDNLLNWALMQNGMIPYQPESLCLHTQVEEVIELMLPLAAMKKVELHNETEEGIVVLADKKALDTILRNLISNALKFTSEGGIKIRTLIDNKTVTIKVEDTGVGIPKDQMSKLFGLEKKSNLGTHGEKGSGLGLLLCKELVELNKGTIKVESELGKGSSFIFTLPHAEKKK